MTMTDAHFLTYVLIGIPISLIAAWIVARSIWEEEEGKKPGDEVEGKYGVPLMFLIFGPFLYGPAIAMSIFSGLVWLFVQSAKPGRIRLPQWMKREKVDPEVLKTQIADLEKQNLDFQNELESVTG